MLLNCGDSSGISVLNMPRPFLYIYKYKYFYFFCRFVDLVKAKTPKITLYTPQAKCLLMENGPDADFEVCFYRGNISI